MMELTYLIFLEEESSGLISMAAVQLIQDLHFVIGHEVLHFCTCCTSEPSIN